MGQSWLFIQIAPYAFVKDDVVPCKIHNEGHTEGYYFDTANTVHKKRLELDSEHMKTPTITEIRKIEQSYMRPTEMA